MGGLLLMSIGYTGCRLIDIYKKKKANSSWKSGTDSSPSAKPQSVEHVVSAEHLAEENTPEQKMRVANHYFYTSVTTAGSAILQSHIPPMRYLSLALLLYSNLPMFRVAERSLIEEKKISGETLNTLIVLVAVSSGQYLSASLVGVFYYLGDKVLARTRDDSRSIIQGVLGEQPRSIWILRDGVEAEIPLKELEKEDTAIIYAGQTFPVDGILVNGHIQVDQHMLTGEFQPVEKNSGDQVYASTMVVAGKAYIRVENTGEETVAAQTYQILQRTADYKTALNQRSEQWVEKTTLPTLAFSALQIPFTGFQGAAIVLSSVKCVNCTRILVSLDTLNHIAWAAHKNVLVKDGRVLELLGNIDTVLFDKTGTLTEDQPEVGDIVVCPSSGMNTDQVLFYAAVAEYRHGHPIAKAILEAARVRDMDLPEVENTNYRVGYGIHVKFKGQNIHVGSARLMESEQIAIPDNILQAMESAQAKGHSSILVAVDKTVCGAIQLRALIRSDVRELMNDLREQGVKHFAIVSGDHQQPTRELAETLNMDAYYANVLPHEKAGIVDLLQQQGRKVCFIGDGINDSIAMKKAQVSVSLAGASPIAMDTAQIILTDGNLASFSETLRIARKLEAHSHQSMVNILASSAILTLATFFFNLTLIQSILLGNGVYVTGLIHSNRPLRLIREEQTSQKRPVIHSQNLEINGAELAPEPTKA